MASIPTTDQVRQKNPVYVEAGRRGMRSRWGPPRIARLEDLSIEQRNLVLALIASAKEAKKAAAADSTADAQEVVNRASTTTPPTS